jgi:hypothetical protein
MVVVWVENPLKVAVVQEDILATAAPAVDKETVAVTVPAVAVAAAAAAIQVTIISPVAEVV